MEAVEPRRPYKRPTTPRSFHPGEGKVLRFYGRWVDEQGPSKEFRKFVVRFHLEVNENNFKRKNNLKNISFLTFPACF